MHPYLYPLTYYCLQHQYTWCNHYNMDDEYYNLDATLLTFGDLQLFDSMTIIHCHNHCIIQQKKYVSWKLATIAWSFGVHNCSCCNHIYTELIDYYDISGVYCLKEDIGWVQIVSWIAFPLSKLVLYVNTNIKQTTNYKHNL